MNRIIASLVAALVVSSAAVAQTAAPGRCSRGRPCTDDQGRRKQGQAGSGAVHDAVCRGHYGNDRHRQAAGEDHGRFEEGSASRRRNSAPPTPRPAAVYSQSGAATAAQAKKNTAVSKEMPKQTVNMGTPAAEKAMEKAAKP